MAGLTDPIGVSDEEIAFADRPGDDTKFKRQACTYGNCCGYKGCWEGSQFW